MTDIEICRKTKVRKIKDVAKELGISKCVSYYGDNKAKIDYEKIKLNKHGKLILMTAINPTPYGEGKTTMSIGLADAFRKKGMSSIVCLREPSMGPVFGIKGGACGGGYSQVVPMDEINLHFTGDFHAITSANNLLCASIDNHIFHGNSLNIDPNSIKFYRCLDMNDRALRNITIHSKTYDREEHFQITAASEVMMILCMSHDINDLKNRLGNILVGYTYDKKPVFAKDLNVEGAMTALLKDAIKPNLVETLEGTPAIIHGGPFANIAHGCNSIIATKTSLRLADYVITEAGFGSDLGAEKFLDIKCPEASISPDAIVVVCTCRALKYNRLSSDPSKEDVSSLKKGFANLDIHIENMKKYNVPVIVCINKFPTDSIKELSEISHHLENLGVSYAVSTSYMDGGEGSLKLVDAITSEISNKIYKFRPLYDTSLSIKEKIFIIAHDIYRSSNVSFTDSAEEDIKEIIKLGMDKLPICIAKTQYSISDDPKLLNAPIGNTLHVKEVRLYNGAGFITVLCGNILTMPGLPSKPMYEGIDVIDNKIEGIS